MNLIGQEDIFGMSYYVFNDRKNFYEDFMHGIIQQWKYASVMMEQNPNYLYSCEANPLESELEKNDPNVLFYRNITVAICFVIAILSMITCLFVSGTIYYDKDLREAHPSLLLGMMSMTEFITCYSAFIWQLNTVKVVCYFGMNNLFQRSIQRVYWFLRKDPSEFTNEMAIYWLSHGNEYVFAAF